MNCPNCQASIDALLIDSVIYKLQRCPHCLEPLEEDEVSFCSHCGQRLPGVAPESLQTVTDRLIDPQAPLVKIEHPLSASHKFFNAVLLTVLAAVAWQPAALCREAEAALQWLAQLI